VDGYDEPAAEFRRVMAYATERALADGVEEDVMAALFDVLNESNEEDEGPGPP
jgi:hypothetical protein